MQDKSFSTTLLVDQSPGQVFNTVTNVRAWWSGLFSERFEGGTERQGDEFTFRAGEGVHYSRQKLVEVVKDKRVVWLVMESKLSFLEKEDEWTGTRIVFDIAKKGSKTELRFTHEGLTPEIECYDTCAPVWGRYVTEKLLPLIENAKPILNKN